MRQRHNNSMPHMKKPVFTTHLAAMPLSQKQALIAWLTTGGKNGIGITYREAILRLQSEFGVKATRDALFKFYHRYHHDRVRIEAQPFDPQTQTLTIVIHLRQ